MILMGWTRTTINKAVNRIRLCFTWAASEELIPAEVAMALRTVAGLKRDRSDAREKQPIGPVSEEQIEATLPNVSKLVADIIQIMRLTGARPGEILSMTAGQIDRSDPSCWAYLPGRHKSQHKDKSRVVFLGSRAQAVLMSRIVKAASGPLFPITLSAFRRAILRGCRKAGIPRWSPNQIRHSVGTHVRSSFGLEAAQCLLGHARADVTQTYAERDMQQAKEVARKIG
jgi:integrase